MFLAEALGKGVYGEFGGAIDRACWDHFLIGDRGYIDHVPEALAVHDGKGCGNSVEHALHVDIDHLIPFVDFERGEWRERHDASVVDEDVEFAEGALGKLEKGIDILPVRYIDRP